MEFIPNENCILGKKRKAFLELLLELHLQDPSFTEEDVREEVDTFMFAGHDTTAMALSWSLYCLGLVRYQGDSQIISRRANVFERMQRIFHCFGAYSSSWQHVPRFFHTCCIEIQKFSQNLKKFDPTRFFPENSKGRHPYAYIPFSAGPRNCIGQKFAMLEMKTVLAYILRRFHITSLDQRDKVVVYP
ncbi:cytochrome P450 4V2 [Caerostris extrusa]|uniref:Cytochrome P450 4V2 n=1 Tax=Caerostris extrusa TaxID=172846 RepID=A0AAV4XCQ3_CAEEX|nr:cytochrome P450 4V2 [Caerostris extrusa]